MDARTVAGTDGRTDGRTEKNGRTDGEGIYLIELLLHVFERRCKAKTYYNMNKTKQKTTEDINGNTDKMKERKKIQVA